MQAALDETDRRRARQIEFNHTHNITPETIRKAIRRGIERELAARKTAREAVVSTARRDEQEYDRDELISILEGEMLEAAEQLQFEKAAALRDRVAKLKAMPSYGSSDKLLRSEVEAPKPLPGMPRSRAGITSKGTKKTRAR
jgi:excinuclease ABC subunit B